MYYSKSYSLALCLLVPVMLKGMEKKQPSLSPEQKALLKKYENPSEKDLEVVLHALLISQEAQTKFPTTVINTYFIGGQTPNHLKAYSWLSRFATLGNSYAMATLGTLYTSGMGLSQPDYTQGIPWLIKAAQRGHPEALELTSILGEAFLHGSEKNHMKPDYTKAFELLSCAAASNNVRAMSHLATLYQGGFIPRQPQDSRAAYWANNDRLALHWYNKAREGGDVDAGIKVATMYMLGQGMQNPNLSVAQRLLENVLSKNPTDHQKRAIEIKLREIKRIQTEQEENKLYEIKRIQAEREETKRLTHDVD